jgi:hypothetical protein
MMSPKYCTVCSRNVETHYRAASSKCFSSYLVELGVDTVVFLCMFCVTKFNKIIKIDDEIKTQIKLKDDKDNLMRSSRELSRAQYLTPINMIKDTWF